MENLPGVPVAFVTHPAFGYFSECGLAPAEISAQARQALREIFEGPTESLVWAHNFSLARNPLFARAVIEETSARGVPLIAHHHDWWFDNRWQRWPELRRAGFRTLASAARVVLPTGSHVRHVAINQADFVPLQRHLGKSAHWLPNFMETSGAPPAARVEDARSWLRSQLGEEAPVWLFPCRLLRRKNVAEALLLTRWLRPEAWLVTTGGVSSDDESQYANALFQAAEAGGWRLRLGILQGDESRKPTVPELLAASEAVVLTSILEGFGLPFLEAAASGRPIIARRFPQVFPDLARFGFRSPQEYDEVLVHLSLFDWPAERQRQRDRFRVWRNGLPSACHKWVGQPMLIPGGRRAVPFSRLTLTAQLEVLSQEPGHSWKTCAPLNPLLSAWRRQAGKESLRPTPWPNTADRRLGGDAWARHFQKIVLSETAAARPVASVAAQGELLHARLAAPHLFPLLWTGQP